MPTVTRHRRALYYDASIPADELLRYHRSEKEMAGLFATETFHPAGFEIPRHAHVLPSFYIVLEGTLTEFYDRDRRDLRTSGVVYTPPGEVHSNVFHEAGGRCFLVELSSRWIDRLDACRLLPHRSFEAKGGEPTWLTARLHREFVNSDAVSPLAVEGLALELLAALHRGSNQADGVFLGDRPGWLRAVRDLLNDRYAERLTLEDLAGHAGVHPVRLARTFRRLFRCSIGEYQRRLRVERAAHELVATRRPLADIAQSVGFADQAHLSRAFKARTGFTPARYRATFAGR